MECLSLAVEALWQLSRGLCKRRKRSVAPLGGLSGPVGILSSIFVVVWTPCALFRNECLCVVGWVVSTRRCRLSMLCWEEGWIVSVSFRVVTDALTLVWTTSCASQIICKTKTQDCRSVLPVRLQVHLLHRHRRTQLKILREVKQQNEVTAQAFPHRRKGKKQIKTGTSFGHRETCCESCQNGQRISQEIWKMKECQHHGTHPQTLLRIQIRNVQEKWYRGGTVSLVTSRKNEIAKCPREPRLQELLAGSALAKQYLEQKSLVTW